MHLRMPSIDRGVQSFVWAVVIFLFLYFGMVAIAVAKGTAFVIALVSGFLVFLLVRTSVATPSPVRRSSRSRSARSRVAREGARSAPPAV